MLFASFSVTTLTAIRSWILAADLWGRSEQTAGYNLIVYANTGDERAYESYGKAMTTLHAFAAAGAAWTRSGLDSQKSRSA